MVDESCSIKQVSPCHKALSWEAIFVDIFNDVAEGADHVGRRRFAIAKAL